jgi:acyl carrier protein
MSAENIEDRVRGIIADVFGLRPEEVGAETSIETVEAWDSLQHLTVVLAIEEEFDIHLDDEQTVAAVSFPVIAEIVRDRLQLPEAR